MKTILDIEFGSLHGDIHFQKLVYQKKTMDGRHNVDALVSTIIDNLSENVVALVNEIYIFIDDHYEESDAFTCCSIMYLGKDSLNNMRSILHLNQWW